MRTLNALGLAVLDGRAPFAPRGARFEVLDERDVRDVLGGLVSVPRRRNTDPLAAWIDALAEVRLTLRDPAEVEASYDGEVEGLPEVFERYRSVLAARHAVDFDEQIVGAIEVLLAEPPVRAAAQRACRLLLVDEFQDLAPAHLLLVRLLASPELAVFGVGDDDQTIYGFSGATPEWLIRYPVALPRRRRPPARGELPLSARRRRRRRARCSPGTTSGSRRTIRAAPGRAMVPDELRVVLTDDTVGATADAVAAALASGADASRHRRAHPGQRHPRRPAGGAAPPRHRRPAGDRRAVARAHRCPLGPGVGPARRRTLPPRGR